MLQEREKECQQKRLGVEHAQSCGWEGVRCDVTFGGLVRFFRRFGRGRRRRRRRLSLSVGGGGLGLGDGSFLLGVGGSVLGRVLVGLDGRRRALGRGRGVTVLARHGVARGVGCVMGDVSTRLTEMFGVQKAAGDAFLRVDEGQRLRACLPAARCDGCRWGARMGKGHNAQALDNG